MSWSSVKWRLVTRLLGWTYKCGGKPWRLATARDGVCYIGLAFRRTEDGTKHRVLCRPNVPQGR